MNTNFKGLTSEEVQARIKANQVNKCEQAGTKTEKEIIKANVFTYFNMINIALAVLVLLAGSLKNMLFIGVVIANAAIGIFQEIRSKRTIDKLSLLASPKAKVLRNGIEEDISVEDVVIDDILILKTGNQICSDSVVVDGEIEVNESLLTGESDPIKKTKGESLLSGSFVVSGKCFAGVRHVGAENYANKIVGESKYIKKPNSEILNSVNLIVKVISFVLIPVGLALFAKQYYFQSSTLSQSILSVVAALIGMIPEGLVLLTSVVFAVGVIRLSRYNTLVQELYCIETLARVDVLCLDKTGTITEGCMEVDNVITYNSNTYSDISRIVGEIVFALSDDNATYLALKDKFMIERPLWNTVKSIPFSSSRKWSGVTFDGLGTYILGAAEFIFKDNYSSFSVDINKYSNEGYRVLVLAHSDNISDDFVIENPQLEALILITDKIRAEAPKTLQYFYDQGVDIKIISGDNPVTVSDIARRAGLKNYEGYIDASTLTDDDSIRDAILKYSVFGRVTPDQKLKFVRYLKNNGHTVAMTGDGVNDVLALKEADCSIAMAEGSDAARTVSNLILLDSNFSSMPKIVEEGRRSINNLQRSAALFISKTVFSIVIAIIFLIVKTQYPFEPIHLSIISTLTIGIPSFILALEPNKDKIKGHFIINVIYKSLPSALPMAINLLLLSLLEPMLGLTRTDIATVAVLVTFITGIITVIRASLPFNKMRVVLLVMLLSAFILAWTVLGSFLGLSSLTLEMIIMTLVLVIFTIVSVISLSHLFSVISNLSK